MCQRCDYLTKRLHDAHVTGSGELIASIKAELDAAQGEHGDALDRFADEYGSPDNERKDRNGQEKR